MALTEGWEREGSTNNYSKTNGHLRACVVSKRERDPYYSAMYRYKYGWKIDVRVDNKWSTIMLGDNCTQKLCSQCADAVLDWILSEGRRCDGGCHIYIDLPSDLTFPGYPQGAKKPHGSKKFREPHWVQVLFMFEPEDDGSILCVTSNELLRPDGTVINASTGRPLTAKKRTRKKKDPKVNEKGLPFLREWEE